MLTPIMKWFDLKVPVIQAPMGGGPSTAELAAAVCDAGGMGAIAAGYLEPDQIEQQVRAVREATDRPFLVNLFILDGMPRAASQERARAVARIAPLRVEVGLAEADDDPPTMPSVSDQFAAVLSVAPAAVSFTFGLPPTAWTAALVDAGCRVIATATTVAEAVAAQEQGVDAVCVQGLEAGAHSGAHRDHLRPSRSTAALLTECRETVSVPLIAAGGIVDGRGAAAAIVQGAAAVQMGTAFLLSPEAGTSPPHREALARQGDRPADTVLARTLTGRWARVIPNRLVAETSAVAAVGYPELHLLTTGLRGAAARMNRPDLMALWAGDLYRLARPRPAADIVREVGATLAQELTSWGSPPAHSAPGDQPAQEGTTA